MQFCNFYLFVLYLIDIFHNFGKFIIEFYGNFSKLIIFILRFVNYSMNGFRFFDI